LVGICALPKISNKAVLSARRPRFLYLLSVAQRRLQAAIQDDAEGRTAARAGVLLALKPDNSSLPLKQLGIQLDLGAPALSGLLDRMARDGLVERRPDAADKRAYNIVLTDAGVRLRAEVARSARQLNDRLCEGFDDDELATVQKWLEAVAIRFPKER
jgi:DNA-binding MarR family transcriptional regulator